MDELISTFGIDWKLIIAQAVNFGVLFVALWLLLYKPVMKTLDERAQKIAQGVKDAEAAGEKLAGADAEVGNRLKDADQKASGIVEHARTAAKEDASRIVKDAEARAVRLAEDADARAKETAAQALRESEKEIARLAILAAAKAVKEK